MDYHKYNKQFRKKPNRSRLVLMAIVALVAVLVSTVFFAQNTDTNQGYRTIRVVETSGNVSVVKGGIEYRAYTGMLLQEGHEIVTTSNSYVRLSLDDDKYVKLESGSRAIFETLGLLGSGKTSIRLERGSLVSEITRPLGAEDSFVINTPNAVLAVRGTFFRVDLGMHSNGEVMADVLTYGGQVASQRVLPTGEKVNEEVLIDAGYKATINMTQEDTYYVVETEDGESVVVDPVAPENPDESPEIVLPTVPIKKDEIDDADLVDIYFAIENGHELFLTAEEVKEDIEQREIDITEHTSVYEKAEEVKREESAVANTTLVSVKADDSKPIAIVKEETADKENNNTTNNSNSSSNTSTGSGLIDGVHVHKEKKVTTEATCSTAGSIVVSCKDCKEVISTTEIPALGHNMEVATSVAPTCTTAGSETGKCKNCDETVTTVVAAIGHTEIYGTTEDVHSQCAICNTILSTEHKMENTVYTAASCTEKGVDTYACACGYTYSNEIAALGHGFAEEFTVDTAATCETAGSQSKHCSRCGEKSEVTEIAALGHEYTEFKEVTVATCTTDGEKAKTCTRNECTSVVTEKVTALGHTPIDGQRKDVHSECSICNEVLSTEHKMENTAYKEATCSEKGVDTYACACGYTYSNEIAALGHEYTEFKEVTVATCTTDGEKAKTCTRNECTSVVTEKVTALGHTAIDGQEKDVHSICSVCDEVLSTEHKMENTAYTPATCTQKGIDTYTCACGYSYTNEIAAIGHDFEAEITIDAVATCEEAGSQSKHCSRCSEKSEVTEIAALGHMYTEFREVTAATCTTDGEKAKTCTRNECPSVVTEKIAATGHTEVNGGWFDCHKYCTTCQQKTDENHVYRDEYVAPTCKDIGLWNHYCDCGYAYSDIIDEKVPHTYKEEFQLDVAPSCTEPGSESRHCEVCNAKTDVREVPAAGHYEMDGSEKDVHSICGLCNEVLSTEHEYTDSVLTPAGCETDGETEYTCYCGYSYIETVSATGHVSENGSETNVHTKCSVCNTILSAQHDMVNVSYVAPSCTETGKDTYECDCGYTYTNEVPALGHDVEIIHDYPALDTPGYYKEYCTVCGEVYEEYDIPMIDALYVEDGNITITEDGYMQDNLDGGRVYYDDYYLISQRDSSVEVECTITVESGNKNLELDGVNISQGGIVINEGATVRLNGKRHNIITASVPITNNGNLKIEGGSFEVADGNTIPGFALSMYDTIPLGEMVEFVAFDGTSYIYELQEEDMSPTDGYYYVWSPTGVPVMQTVFEDPTILQYVEDNFDTDGDRFLTEEEIALVTSLEFDEDQPITTLLGVQYLRYLENLSVWDATEVRDGEINLTRNLNLQTLMLKGISVSSLNILNQSQLQELVLDGSSIQNLDLSINSMLSRVSVVNCTSLTTLNARSADGNTSMLSDLSLAGCTNLTDLDISYTGLTSIDLSGLRSLTNFEADYYLGTSLSLANCSNLSTFSIASARNLTDLSITGASSLDELDIQTLESLEKLNISSCSAITQLNTSACTNLSELNINRTGIVQLDLSSNTALTRLDSTACTKLRTLNASNTALDSLVVTGGATALEEVNVSNTNISLINVSGCTSLYSVNTTNCEGIVELSISETLLSPDTIDLNGGSLQNLTMVDCPNMPKQLVIGEGGIAQSVINLIVGGEFERLEINAPTARIVSIEGAIAEVVLTNISGVERFVAENCVGLTSLDLSSYSNLELVSLKGNEFLTSLNLSNVATLQTLTIERCALPSVSVTGCSALTNVSISECGNLTTLDLSQNTALNQLMLGMSNSLSELSVSGCIALSELNLSMCDNITSLNVTNAGAGDGTNNPFFKLTVTSGSQTATAASSAIGWDVGYMNYETV